MDPATLEATLIENVRSTWRSISAETLNNLMYMRPDRMEACLKKRGDFNK